MRIFITAACSFLLVSVALAQVQTGHILSEDQQHSSGVISHYNPATHLWGYGVVGTNSSETEIQVGSFVYTCDGVNKHVLVGADYPAVVSKKKLILTVGKKTVKFRIDGIRDVAVNARNS